MEATQEKIKYAKADKDLSYFNKNEDLGTWKLEVLNVEPEKFSLVTLMPYVHPIAKKQYLPSSGGNPLPFLVIDKMITKIYPRDNDDEVKLLDWLIAHPKVSVPGITLPEAIKNKKEKGILSLVNLDQQDMTDIEEGNIIDQILGRLSFDAGMYSVNIEKLRYIASDIGKPYKDKRFVKRPLVEKNFLRKNIKGFVRESKENAQRVAQILDNIEGAKRSFIIKVLMEHNVIQREFSIYKYEGKILGSTFASCVDFLSVNPEVEEEMFTKAKELLKKEGYAF